MRILNDKMNAKVDPFNQCIDCNKLKVAIFEYTASTLFPTINVGNPLNHTCVSSTDEDPVDYNHVFKVASRLRKRLGPNAIIDFLPQNNAGVDYAIANGYHIATFSGGNMFADDDKENKLAETCFLIAAAGNNYGAPENITPRNKWWCAVSAMIMYEPGYEIELEWDAAYGAMAIKLSAFAGYYDDRGNRIFGSSLASPEATGLIGQYVQRYLSKMNFLPTATEIYSFLDDCCIPVLKDPMKEGRGMLILPDFSKYSLGTILTLGSKEYYQNGVKKTLNVPPYILNSNTMVQLTLIRELGFSVAWDGLTRRVTISSPTKVVVLTIDSTTIYVNGEAKQISVAPCIVNGNTMVQLTVIRELGLRVLWNEAKKRVIIK